MAINLGGLIFISLVGLSLRRLWIFPTVLAMLFIVYQVQHYARAPYPFSLHDRWPDLFHVFVELLLNTLLLMRYVAWSRLSPGRSEPVTNIQVTG